MRAANRAICHVKSRGTNRANAGRVPRLRKLLLVAAISAIALPAHAIQPVPSFTFLVTGNGFGFQVFDTTQNKITQYLEHPYRYLAPNPTNPDGEGIIRRNLVFDTYFGVKVGAGAQWLGNTTESQVGYVNESNMIRSAETVGGVLTESFFVAPFAFQGNATVMLLKVTNTTSSPVAVTAYSMHNFKMGTATNPDMPGADGESITYDATAMSASETGPGGGAMIYAPIGGVDASSCDPNAYTTIAGGGGITQTSPCSGTDEKNAFQRSLGTLAPGASAWWGVAVLFDENANVSGANQAWSTFLAGRAPDQLYSDILAEHEAWRVTPIPGLSATETSVWRQAETTLRMGQIEEPYTDAPQRHNTGMILASLPPGEWHTGWVRDATYATTALARVGHFDRAKASLDFFLDADAGNYGSYVANQPYRISVVRYFGNGTEESDYSGQPTRNIEIDGWGLFLWAARNYVDASGDVTWLTSMTKKGDLVYDAIRNGVAEPLAANLETSGMVTADTSIWEVHWANRQHFAYTTMTAARGFCDMATLARRAGRTDDIQHYKDLAQQAQSALKANFIDQHMVLAGSVEKLATGANYHDGSTVEAVPFSLLDTTDLVATSSMNALSYLQTPAGGYKRVEGSTDPYDTNEWILIDLRASSAFRRMGQAPNADALLDWVTAQASANYNLEPELYNTISGSGPIGAYTGSIPMVGYGAGAYLMAHLDRVQLYEHADCGDKDLNQYPDSGPVVTNEGDGGPNGLSSGRTGFACACSGGPGAPGNAVMLAIAGLLVLRRRRR